MTEGVLARVHDTHGMAPDKSTCGPDISITEVVSSDAIIKVTFEIRNGSGQDVWICQDISAFLNSYDCEMFMAEDRETLLVRRRLDVDPCKPVSAPPHGRYVRLRDGQSLTESVFLPLPVKSRFFWASPTSASEIQTHLKRLALEIGYYPGDLPDMVHRILTGPREVRAPRGHDPYHPTLPPPALKDWYKSVPYWNWLNWTNKNIEHRSAETLIPWTGSSRMGEQALRASRDELTIPYEEGYERARASPPDLGRCNRLEILYRPSALDYFFPYPNERVLMNPAELSHLRSLRRIVIDDRTQIAALTHEIGGLNVVGGIVCERSSAQVSCYHDEEQVAAFTIWDDRAIVTDSSQCIRCSRGIASLKTVTSAIHPFLLRLECAENLMNLSWLLHYLYDGKRSYPVSTWCSVLSSAPGIDDIPLDYRMRYMRCPSGDQAKCDYAVNSSCKPDSPGDTVLLFEARAGWNQHGGPELFTFDNHDPRGGLVLLNDGTVKFIRTEEELKQLRWK
jgi:hypothetical protein